MIFVAGKTGQVARALEKEATARGIDLKTHGRPDFDIADASAVAASVKASNPTAVVNAAAYTAVDQAESEEAQANLINAAGAAALAKAAHSLGIPFIHISTDYVFDGTKSTPYLETDPVGPTGAYGRSKLAGEDAVLDANPQAIILRTAWVYSPWGKNFLKTMLSLAGRDTLSVVADQQGNPTYAPDIARAILDILREVGHKEPSPAQAGIYHLAGTGDTNWHEFATAIFDAGSAFGLPKPNVKAITTADYPTPATRPANSRLDCSKVREIFGVEMPHWRESTEACVKQLSKDGQLG